MLEMTLFVLGMQYFTDAIFDKFGVWEWITKNGMKAKRKWIFNLSFCRFCQLFWLSVVWTLFGCVLFGYEITFVAVPFVVKGITYLIEK